MSPWKDNLKFTWICKVWLYVGNRSEKQTRPRKRSESRRPQRRGSILEDGRDKLVNLTNAMYKKVEDKTHQELIELNAEILYNKDNIQNKAEMPSLLMTLTYWSMPKWHWTRPTRPLTMAASGLSAFTRSWNSCSRTQMSVVLLEADLTPGMWATRRNTPQDQERRQLIRGQVKTRGKGRSRCGNMLGHPSRTGGSIRAAGTGQAAQHKGIFFQVWARWREVFETRVEQRRKRPTRPR